MSVKDLREALDGPDGVLSAYLEVSSDAEIKADILALIGDSTAKREQFAAQFMAAMISNPVYDQFEACLYSERAVMYADQLIGELEKVKP